MQGPTQQEGELQGRSTQLIYGGGFLIGHLGCLLQVLRQLRAQHVSLGDAEAVRGCERRIDALVGEANASCD